MKQLFSILLVVAVVVVAAIADAQQPKKVPRIGYLSSLSSSSESYPCGGHSARAARAWLHRRTEHCYRVPIRGGKAQSGP